MTVDAGTLLGTEPLSVSGWSVDTRSLASGDLFFALSGPCHDGHNFVVDAAQKGAAGVVVERPVVVATRTFVVASALQALQAVAASARRAWGGTVIGVTGSAGKTSTKDAIAHLLGSELPVGKTAGNFNNHVGVPLSILRLPDACRIGVIELGMNHAGEIRDLATIARPEIGVVTMVGWAHAENFPDGVEGIARAKRELIESLPPGGTAVLNADDERVRRFREIHLGRTITYGLFENADVRATQVDLGPEWSRFTLDGVRFEIPLAGVHAVRNVLAAAAVASLWGIPAGRLQDAARTLAPSRMRGERLVHQGVTIWNDCYNANPEAVRSMLDVLKATPARRRIAVLGEMLELGRSAEPLHRGVGSYVAAGGIDVLIGIRGAALHMVDEAVREGMSGAAYFFDDPEPAGDFARELLQPGDAALFKGSRGVRVEKALERVLR